MNFPCPLCGQMQIVRINRRSKPYLRCDHCGLLMFVNRQPGIRAIKQGTAHRADECSNETAASYFDS